MPQIVPFVDGHNDVLLSLHEAGEPAETFLSRRDRGHLDLVRARDGGWAAGFFAIFVPPEHDPRRSSPLVDRTPPYSVPLPEPLGAESSRRHSEAMMALLLELELRSSAQVAIVRTADELEACVSGGPLGAILHFEGAEPIDPDLANLKPLYDRGLRSIGIVWSRANAFATGVQFGFPSSPDLGPGLTDAGRDLVRDCNRLGILLDLSHLNERGFRDVAELSKAPLIASHSNAHALSPNSRNLTDEQLELIASSGGLVGITVHAGMLRSDGRLDTRTPLSCLLDHIDHVVGRIGIDHIGFGSDFDGAIVIDEIGDAAGLPRLVEGLRERGYDEDAIAKLAHGNWLRVVRETWRD
jgi:membrane dipeptidase